MSLINCKVELALEGFERSYNEYNEYKTKNETKHTTNEHRYLLKSNFLGFKRLFALIYLSRNNDIKHFNARKYNFPKGIIKNYNIYGKTFMTKQLIQIKTISRN